VTEKKKPMKSIYRKNKETPEGKYLVKRRDGTVVEWPSFVLGARDPIAEVALRAYAHEVIRIMKQEPAKARDMGLTPEFAESLFEWADEWRAYRLANGTGDPGMGRHRKDDPATIEEMKRGYSA
jgi:hypothetical protein